MSEKVNLSVYLTDLDTILDTRFSTWIRLGEKALEKAINEKYADRLTDRVEGFVDEFKEAYANRDVSILKDSIVTYIPEEIRDFARGTIDNSCNSPYVLQPKVVINIHPYSLTQKEIEGVLGAIKAIVRTDGVQYGYIDRPTESLTPFELKNLGVSVFNTYHADDWIEEMSKANVFEKQSCPDITLVRPKLVDINLQNHEEVLENLEVDFFHALEQHMSMFINLITEDVAMYCAKV